MPLTVARKQSRHRTKQQFVYSALRRGIMSCALAPGERLVIDDIARRLRVSAIPVREALQTLQSEGLVANVPHVGATVALISRASIVEVFTILEGLEVVAGRAAARKPDPPGVAALEVLVEAMESALRARRHEEWAELNRRFHLALCRMADMPMLHDMMERVLDHWDRLRRYFFSGVLMHRLQQAQQEHRALLAALHRGDAAAVEEILREHNQGAMSAYATYLQGSSSDARD
jgi:DNA-binding GntR family transcriptional regulator